LSHDLYDGLKIHHDYPIHLLDIVNHIPRTNTYTPSGLYQPLVNLHGGINDNIATVILIQLVLKLVKKLKASLRVHFSPNEGLMQKIIFGAISLFIA